MNKTKEFRKNCEEAKSSWKRIAYIYQFIREDYALEIPKKRGIFNKRKSNTQIVIEELKEYIKKYEDFFIFNAILDSPTISTEADYQEIFDIFVKQVNKHLDGNLDRSTIIVCEKFKDILKDDNLATINKMFSKAANEYKAELDEMIEEYQEKVDNESNNQDVTDEIDNKELLSRIETLRLQLSNNYITPYLNIIHSIAKDEIKNNEGEKSDRLVDLFNIVGEDLSMLYLYVDDFNLPVQLFFDDPRSEKTPDECIGLYEYLMEYNILSFKKLGINNENTFSNFVNSFKNNCLPNISWTNDELRSFLDKCQSNDIDIPLAFLVIDEFKGKNEELDEICNNFLSNNKDDYLLWCMQDEYEFYEDKFNGIKLYSDNDFITYKTIIEELMKRQGDKVKYTDFECYRTGSISTVTKVGDYVVKVGPGRYIETIPNHRRILQPIIRERIENVFIEVADAVDIGASQEEINQVFNEFLQSDLAWMDAGKANIGKLRRKNVPRHNIEKKDVDGITYVADESSSDENATNITGKIEEKPLEEGECVVTDTDLIFDLKTMTWEQYYNLEFPPYMTSEMKNSIKKRFIELHTEKNKDNTNIENEKIENKNIEDIEKG